MSRVAIPLWVLSLFLLAALLITVPVAADTQDYFPSTSDRIGVDLNGGTVTGDVQTSPTGPRTSPALLEAFAVAPDISGTCPGPYWHRGPAGNAWTHDSTNQEMSFAASLSPLATAGFFSHGGGSGASCDAGPYGDETDLAMSARFRVTSLPSLTHLYLGFHDTASGSGRTTVLGPAIDILGGGWSACVVLDGGLYDCSPLQPYSSGYHTATIRWYSANRTAFVQVDGDRQTFTEPGGGTVFGFPTGAIGTVMMVDNLDLGAAHTIDVDVDDISVPKIRDGHWRSFDIQTPNVQAIELRWLLTPDTSAGGSRLGNRMYGNTSDQTTNYWRFDTVISSGSFRQLTDADSSSGSLEQIVGTWTFETRLAHDDGLTLSGTHLQEVTIVFEIQETGAPPPPEQPPFGLPPLGIIAPIMQVCNLWLLLLLAAVIMVALVVRRDRRRTGPR